MQNWDGTTILTTLHEKYGWRGISEGVLVSGRGDVIDLFLHFFIELFASEVVAADSMMCALKLSHKMFKKWNNLLMKVQSTKADY